MSKESLRKTEEKTGVALIDRPTTTRTTFTKRSRDGQGDENDRKLRPKQKTLHKFQRTPGNHGRDQHH